MNILIADDSELIRETLSRISVDASGEMLGGKRRRERLRVLFYPSIQYSSNRRNGTENEILTPAYQTPVKKLKIIIAEDDESSSMLISIVVRKFTKEIIKVQTGTKAVEACRNKPDVDLILMDIQMPEMDGYEATRQIRQFNKDVVIIAQTAYALAGDRERAIAAGCNDYLAKPIKKNQLAAVMQKYF